MALGGIAALSMVDTAARRAALLPLLSDPVPSVRWNAALLLGRWGVPEAESVLTEILDRSRLASASGVRPIEVETILREAVFAARGYPRLADRIRQLAESDPSLKVRAAARSAME
jgi:HEAT repeat protein